jgi:DnaD/phage-associated family protein
MERQFKGIWIPAEIWLDENLTVMEKVLYAEIDSFCGNGKECFCSNAHFAKMLQVSERQVRRLLCSLEEKGVISRRLVYKEGSKEVDKRYLKAIPSEPFDTTPMDIDVRTPGEEIVRTPGEGNVRDTNTVFTNPSSSKGGEEDEDWQEVLDSYQDNIHPISGSIELDTLKSLYDDYRKKWLLEGIKVMALNNAKSIRYLTTVLESWERDGFKSAPSKEKPKQEPRVLTWEEERAKQEEQYRKDLAYMEMLEEMELIQPVEVHSESNSSYTVFVGTLENKSDKTHYFIKVKGEFKDDQGNTIDTDWTYACGDEGLRPGESTKFKLSVDRDERITNMRCYTYDFS